MNKDLLPTTQQAARKWRSCARWEHKHGFQDDLTFDEHDTKEQAKGVCDMLKRDGLGGERCHFPIETWVERVGFELTEAERHHIKGLIEWQKHSATSPVKLGGTS